MIKTYTSNIKHGRAAVVHLNFRAGSIFQVPVCTVFPGHWVIKHLIGLAGATRLTRSDFRLNLLLLKGQGCLTNNETVQSNLRISLQ